MITLKLATSLDGRIATASGESQWITGEAAREQGHRLRAEHDAIVVGIGTVLADDPMLNVRLFRYDGEQPARVVLDTHLRLPATSQLARTADVIPTYVVTRVAAEIPGTQVKVLTFEPGGEAASQLDRVPPEFAVAALADEGLDRLYVEGGGQIAASFLNAGLVDRIEWFRAPIILGSEGRPAVGGLGLGSLSGAPRFKRVEVSSIGEDLWERYERL